MENDLNYDANKIILFGNLRILLLWLRLSDGDEDLLITGEGSGHAGHDVVESDTGREDATGIAVGAWENATGGVGS